MGLTMLWGDAGTAVYHGHSSGLSFCKGIDNICPKGFEGLKIMKIPRANLVKQLLRFWAAWRRWLPASQLHQKRQCLNIVYRQAMQMLAEAQANHRAKFHSHFQPWTSRPAKVCHPLSNPLPALRWSLANRPANLHKQGCQKHAVCLQCCKEGLSSHRIQTCPILRHDLLHNNSAKKKASRVWAEARPLDFHLAHRFNLSNCFMCKKSLVVRVNCMQSHHVMPCGHLPPLTIWCCIIGSKEATPSFRAQSPLAWNQIVMELVRCSEHLLRGIL